MTIGGSSSVEGYRSAEASLAARGDRIAKATTQASQDVSAVDAGKAPPAQTPDITSDVVGLSTDRLAGAYNLKALKVQNQMLGDLLDIMK
jgi:hypothetical protein